MSEVPKDMRGQLRWAKERIDSQLQRLSKISSGVEAREKSLFEKVVSLEKSGQSLRASSYSIELSEVRKLKDIVRATVATLDAISLKLEGAVSLGDAVAAMSGAREAIRALGSQVKGMNPEFDRVLAEIDEILSSTQQSFPDIQVPRSEEAEQILMEAAALADLRLRGQQGS